MAEIIAVPFFKKAGKTLSQNIRDWGCITKLGSKAPKESFSQVVSD
jgi:hypothetical protein